MTDPEDGTVVVLRLTHAEALVFFEWLAREDAAENFRTEDAAEQRVLWRLEGQLESVLEEVLRPDYEDAVRSARKVVRES